MLVPSMDDSVFQKSAVVSQHSYRINKRDHATKLTLKLHTYRQEPMYVMALLESKPMELLPLHSVLLMLYGFSLIVLQIALTLKIQSGKCCALGEFLIKLWSKYIYKHNPSSASIVYLHC